MTPFKLPIYLLLSILVIACGKDKAEDKPDVPCLGFFSCKINGVPFENSGDFGCESKSYTFSTDSNTVTIMGRDCRVSENGFRMVVFDIYHVIGTGDYPIGQVNCAYYDERGRSQSHNLEVNGSINLISFVESDYSDDWHGGYAEGTFWFTSYNEELQDTVYVTNGEFCGRL